MKASRFLTTVGTVLAIATLAGCSAGPTTGVLTGKAWPCAGPHFIHVAHLTVFRGTTPVDHAQIPGGSTYRFVLPPGRYLVTNTGGPGGAPNVVVETGRTTHVNVPDLCK